MEFDELLNNLWMFDSEVFAHDVLWVFISYKTHEKKIFHNPTPDELESFISDVNPILMGYNAKGYDKYILKASLLGYCPEEIKDINDFIIGGKNGWEYPFVGYCELPPIWDLMLEIVPRKSLKELEGNLRLNITETTVSFDLPTKWTKEQYEEVLYYCTCDAEALFPIFENLINKYKSKYIIAKIGTIEPRFALSLTDANLTATLLKAERQEHTDNFAYKYPNIIDKNKIPKEVLNYIDNIITHNDLDYVCNPPMFKYDECVIQLGIGGIHGAKETTYEYESDIRLRCD